MFPCLFKPHNPEKKVRVNKIRENLEVAVLVKPAMKRCGDSVRGVGDTREEPALHNLQL
jgi:hypothetical protein